jgi:DNA uptake protein ComE-like DNA-binding protein
MKKAFQSYISFTHNERKGLIALSVLLLILLTVRLTMHLWVRPDIDTAKERRLVEAWAAFKKKAAPKAIPIPDIIDINSADSATLVSLKGIGPVTAHNIIIRRANKPFTDISQLKEVGAFSEMAFEELKQHFVIGNRMK